MISKSIIKFIPSLLYSMVFLGLFYWQFIAVYSFIIDHFMESKLFILYGYLFVYLFWILMAAVSLINLLHNYLIHNRSFVFVTVATLLLFYGISFNDFTHVINYFVNYPLPSNSIMGMIFFMVLAVGYGLYSIGVLFFTQEMPLGHILIFAILGLLYSSGFIHYYCMPLF